MSAEETAGAKPRRRGRRRTDYSKTATEGARTPVVKTSIRTEPIRVTLDLKPKQHAELKRWCNGAAVDTGLPEVALAPVLRILGELLVDPKDKTLAERVRAELIKRAEQL
ncbi:hypothetical protein [Streptomyces mirabilis]|uniref:hypothetical protein n=1 Tax=Streptomyces mirabilis TaxID=68239 RepID=UPI0022525DB3|nr:hypothetical protein [Streptomyces mirabilis]MCX4429434.1 hypothetical protein [Streptomyces mirabilis]